VRRRRKLLLGVALGLLLVLGSAWTLYREAAGEPSAELGDRWYEGQRVLDRRGRTLRDLPSAEGAHGRALDLAEIGDRLVLCTLWSEDRRFYQHSGVDLAAIVRALGQNAREVRLVSGASTITQQLVKLLDGRGEPRPRSLAVKLRESARAQNLEETLDKRDILEAYLNRLGYGHGLTGPAAAAQGYFGVEPTELSWAEAAFLAVLPRAPTYLDPYRYPERVERRQRALLEALRAEGLLADADYARATAERVTVRPLARAWHAPHFVESLRAEGRLGGGAVTRTTIELDLQRDVQGLVRSHTDTLRSAGADNAATIVVDNASGEVLAYVASADFGDAEHSGQIDMVRSPRQPGSTLKPFVYAAAFARGHDAAEMLADVPTRFGQQSGAYAPGNFDGVFRGPVSAREALAGSLNVPAVRLASELPDGALLTELRALGLRSLDRDPGYYGLALALGSGEVTLRELATAYAVLARGGRGLELRTVVAEASELGTPADGSALLAPSVAALVTETLSDPWARVRGLGSRGPFDLDFPVAVKTGTSSGYRDSWAVGYTRERTVAVWVGNADGRPTHALTGGAGAGPLFVDAMRRAMREVRSRGPLWDAELLVARPICPLSGKPVGPACPAAVTRSFLRERASAERATEERCTLHRRAEPSARLRAREPPWRCAPNGSTRIVVLADEFASWLASQPLGAPGRDADGLGWYLGSSVPGCADAATEPPRLRIDEPAPGSVLLLSRAERAERQQLELRASLLGPAAEPGVARLDEVQFVLDGVPVGRSRAPFRASVPLSRGEHELVVRPADPRVGVRLGESRFSVR
jgi:penicillin-binding protein 1C